MNSVIGIKLSDLRGKVTEQKKEEPPSFWGVIFLNDQVTPVDFVIEMIETVFRKDHEFAVAFVGGIEKSGSGVIGRFTRDIAEVKMNKVMEAATTSKYPLTCELKRV